ncbi:MAG: hypothetical protein AB7G17_02530 [Phycisphaerales bacterium]
MTQHGSERRGEKRRPRSEPVWWRSGAGDRKIGWLIDRSARGAQLLCVGRRTPNIADPLDVQCLHPETGDWTPLKGYVRRVSPMGGGLFLIGMYTVIDRPRLRRQSIEAKTPACSPEPVLSLSAGLEEPLAA